MSLIVRAVQGAWQYGKFPGQHFSRAALGPGD